MEESKRYLVETLPLNRATGFVQYDYIPSIKVLTAIFSGIRHRSPSLSDEIQATVTAVQ